MLCGAGVAHQTLDYAHVLSLATCQTCRGANASTAITHEQHFPTLDPGVTSDQSCWLAEACKSLLLVRVPAGAGTA